MPTTDCLLFIFISEPSAIIVAALIGAGAGIIGAYVTFVLPERKKRPNLLADFLDTIGKDVAEMISMFEKEEIPHTAGHALDSEIDFFEKATNRKLLSPLALKTLSDLKQLSQEAESVDVALYLGRNGDLLREEWVKKAQGIIGDLRGESSKLRAGSWRS